MKSFAVKTKDALTREDTGQPQRRCCRLAELTGLLLTCGAVTLVGGEGLCLTLRTEHPGVAGGQCGCCARSFPPLPPSGLSAPAAWAGAPPLKSGWTARNPPGRWAPAPSPRWSGTSRGTACSGNAAGARFCGGVSGLRHADGPGARLSAGICGSPTSARRSRSPAFFRRFMPCGPA